MPIVTLSAALPEKNDLDLLYVCNAGAELSKLKLTPLFVLYTIYMIHRTDI